MKKPTCADFTWFCFIFHCVSLCSFCYMLPRHLQVPAVFVWVNITPRLCGVFVVLGVCLETHGGRLQHDGAVLGSGRGCNRSRLRSWKSHPKLSSNRYNLYSLVKFCFEIVYYKTWWVQRFQKLFFSSEDSEGSYLNDHNFCKLGGWNTI